MVHSNECKSIFKNGSGTTSTEAVTAIWIKLINQMEQSKATLAKTNRGKPSV